MQKISITYKYCKTGTVYLGMQLLKMMKSETEKKRKKKEKIGRRKKVRK